MVNLTNEPLWNVDGSEVGVKVKEAIQEVIYTCRSILPQGTTVRQSHMVAVLNLFESIDLTTINSWSVEKANKFIGQTVHIDEVMALPSTVDEIFQISHIHYCGFRNFVKLVVVQLWINKAIVVPIKYNAPINADDILDTLIIKSKNKILCDIRSTNKLSSIKYAGSDKLEDRNRRANHWFRLLLNTSFYDHELIKCEDIKSILCAGLGEGNTFTRYYVVDFILSIASDNEELKGTVTKLINEEKAIVRANIPKPPIRKRDPDKPVAITINDYIQQCIDYSNAISDISVDHLISDVVGTARLYKIFGGLNADMGLPVYQGLPEKVRKFCELINKTFTSFVMSQKVLTGKNHAFSLNLTIFYISIYLPRFYLDRDGSLDEYPITLNDFSCPYYVTRDTLLDGIAFFEKETPLTLLSFIKKYSDIFEWINDTHYVRVLYIEKYFEYLSENNTILPNADKLINTFTNASYPKVSKRFGTNKKPISRKYFATFVCLLYTLEYLVTHLNEMAEGRVPGSVNGELRYVNRTELEEHHLWRNLWGKVGVDSLLVDLTLLNYTPIFLHNGKYRPLRKCHRFYTITNYQQKSGQTISRANPHAVRTTQLMSETGIRQKHLLWLDIDRYDYFVDRSFNHILAPLLVNTDKAHDEWTAIVSSRVIEICDRQKEFYLNCGDPSFEESIWYSETKGAKFGRFRPLFRQPNAATGWSNREVFPKLLWTLQHIIREDLKDEDFPDLVFLSHKEKKGERKQITEFSEESLSRYRLVSPHTPHALRAGFVLEAIRFLPPSLIGEFMTGQTEALVWYYAVNNPEELTSHQQLLANYIAKNAEAISQGDAPELAAVMAKVNQRLMADIEVNPVAAVQKYKLMSLTGIDADKSGLKLILAKKYTKLAFTPTHICPFDNKCPREVVEQYGQNRPHALCPYAVRGVVHLEGVSAEKDKNFELMYEYQQKIKEYKKRPKPAQNASELEGLNESHDNALREATALEAIEQQLYILSQSENSNAYIVQDRDTLVKHFKKVELTEAEHLIKRLIDVQSFPDLDSPVINRKFAFCRHKMLLNNSDLFSLITNNIEDSESKLLTAQLKSLMDVKGLDVKDIFKIASSKLNVEKKSPTQPFIASLLAPSKDQDHDGEENHQALRSI